jgi:MFS family permease
LAEPTQAEQKRQALRAARAIAPGVMLAGVAGGIAFPILPVVGLRVGLSLPFIGLILAANRLVRIVASPVAGALADRIGGRRVLVAGLVIQIGVMALYWVGVTVDRPGLFFLLARLLHGPGSACVFVAAQVLALQAGGRAHSGAAAGTVRGAMMVGMPAGLVIGGLMAARWGERVTFEAAIVAVVLATIVAALAVPNLRSRPSQRPDFRVMVRGLADRRLGALGLLNFATFFSAQGTVLATIVLVLGARGLTVARLGVQGTAAVAMGLLVVAAGVVSPSAGRLGDRVRGHARVAVGGLVVLCAGLGVTGVASSTAVLGLAMVLVGLGMGAMTPALLALVSGVVPSERQGSAVGAIQLLGDVGGTLGPIAGTTLFAYGQALPFVVSAAVCACAIPFGLWLVRLERMPPRPSGRAAEGS